MSAAAGEGGGPGARAEEEAEDEVCLAHPPQDGISSMEFSPVPSEPALLMVSSWDGTVRLYDVAENATRRVFTLGGPALSSCFWGGTALGFAGGLERKVQLLDFETGAVTTLGEHGADDATGRATAAASSTTGAVRCVQFMPHQGWVVSGGWDARVKVWDPRVKSAIASLELPGKCFTMDTTPERIVVGTSGRHIVVYDHRNLAAPEQQRESCLKHQTRCIATFPDGAGFASGSIEGRVALEYFDLDEAVQAKRYTFRCHRTEDVIYPINTIAFHPRLGSFATGGCDGTVSIWDGEHKRRLHQFRQYPTSISSVAFNHDGTQIAIAASYTFEQGDREHPEDNIFVSDVADSQAKPRAKKSKSSKSKRHKSSSSSRRRDRGEDPAAAAASGGGGGGYVDINASLAAARAAAAAVDGESDDDDG